MPNQFLNGAAWTLGRWVTAGALEQGKVERSAPPLAGTAWSLTTRERQRGAAGQPSVLIKD